MCGHVLNAQPGQCSLRGLAQFQIAEFQRFELSTPLADPAGRVAVPAKSVIIVSSIGSPETDRGPP
ncbi:MAG: hypothetical protein ACRD3H_13310, partial [Terriglobales bacterium]